MPASIAAVISARRAASQPIRFTTATLPRPAGIAVDSAVWMWSRSVASLSRTRRSTGAAVASGAAERSGAVGRAAAGAGGGGAGGGGAGAGAFGVGAVAGAAFGSGAAGPGVLIVA